MLNNDGQPPRRQEERIGVLVLVGVLLSSFLTGEAVAEPSTEDLQRWVAELGDPSYATRELASRRLREAGLAARPHLEKVSQSEDMEVRNRAQELLAELSRLERVKDMAWLGVELAEAIAESASHMESLEGKPLRLGVSMMELSRFPGLADRIKVERGVLLAQIQEKSPAEKGGLSRWDLVLSFNGRAVAGGEELRAAVREAPANKPVRIEIARLTNGGRRLEITVVMGEPVPEPDPHGWIPIPMPLPEGEFEFKFEFK